MTRAGTRGVTSTSAGVTGLLRANARMGPGKDALVHPSGRGGDDFTAMSYGELDTRSDALAAGFRRIGITRGTRTILMVKPGPELFVVVFALFKAGAVPVVVDPGMGIRRMLHCYRTAGAEAFVGTGAAQVIRLLNPRLFRGLRARVSVGPRRFPGAHALTDLLAGADPRAGEPEPVDEDDLLVVNFTTGSTGPAKGVEYTHRTVVAMARTMARAHGQTHEDVTLSTVPLFGLLDMLIGSTTVLAPLDPTRVADADPARIADTVQQFGVTSMFASPALLDPLTEYLKESGRRLPTLRCVASGGAPVRDAIVARAREVFEPGTRVLTSYGATEALPITSIGAGEILGGTRELTHQGHGTCVGKPVEGIAARIVTITDEPMPDWSGTLIEWPDETGEIVVAGPSVSPRYHRSPEDDARAKMAEGDRVWHRTGDLGRMDGSGRIWFCGRKSHRVATAEGPLYTVQCEGVFNAHPEVHRTALVGVGEPGAQRPVLCVELRAGVPKREFPRIEEELRRRGGDQPVTKPIGTFLRHPGFPVDIRHNAKIDRQVLAEWAAAARLGGRGGVGWRGGVGGPHPLWLVPILGWAYLGYGLAFPFEHPLLQAVFWIDAFLSVVVHGIQIVPALRVGRLNGHRPALTAALTMLLGATWWKRLPGGRASGGRASGGRR